MIAGVVAWGAHHLLTQSGRRDDGGQGVIEAQRRADEALEEARRASEALAEFNREHPLFVADPTGRKCRVPNGLLTEKDYRRLGLLSDDRPSFPERHVNHYGSMHPRSRR